MPKDLTSNFQDGIPYELDVDIIKDCTTLSKEIKDVFDIIDKDNNKELLEKVRTHVIHEIPTNNFFFLTVFMCSQIFTNTIWN